MRREGMYSMNDAVLGRLEFTYVWKGTCNVEFLGKRHALTLAVQGEPDKPVTDVQRRAFESAQKRLADTSAFLETLLAYCRIDGPEDGLDAESLPYVVHPETLLITWDGGFGLLCSYDYDESEQGVAVYAHSPEAPMQAGPQSDAM